MTILNEVEIVKSFNDHWNELWQKNVETVIKKSIPHVSCYALTVEPKTVLNK